MEQPNNHPFLDRSFPIRWSSLTAAHVEPDVRHAIALAETRIRVIEERPLDEARYGNTILAMEAADDELSEAWSKIEHLNHVMDTPEFREAYHQALPLVVDFSSQLMRRPRLWQAVKAAAAQAEREGLSDLEKRHLGEVLEDFRESGADLPEDARERMGEIDRELARLSQSYSENVLDSTNAWELVLDTASALEGLPSVARENARMSALEKGLGSDESPRWRFTLKAPSYVPMMRFLKDPALREKAWRANCLIGAEGKWDNAGNVVEMLRLRKEMARLLGYDHLADLTTHRRMAKSGERARAFVLRLRETLGDAYQREMDQLAEHRSRVSGEPLDLFEPWDLSWWSESLRKASYDFDEEALRPYLSIDRVVEGMFSLAESLFGLRLVARATSAASCEGGDVIEVWHPEVVYYDVYDGQGGQHLGGFYTDWFPRESKRSGAWMDTLRPGVWGVDAPSEKHLVILCGNLTPRDSSGRSLLSHDEVCTIFHEFGHLLHQMCGRVPVKSLNGISVAWDFVELPSQMLENWCWERESLDLFARHHETGARIPDELFTRMKAARHFQEGLFLIRQLSLSILDLDLHMAFVGEDLQPVGDLDTFAAKAVKDYRPRLKTLSPPIHKNFGHLFSGGGGYAAGYYSYKWSEVLEADAFGRFKEEGVLNGDVGMAFRDTILSVGKRVEPWDAFRNFRGRGPSLAPYLIRSGLLDGEVAREAPEKYLFE